MRWSYLALHWAVWIGADLISETGQSRSLSAFILKYTSYCGLSLLNTQTLWKDWSFYWCCMRYDCVEKIHHCLKGEPAGAWVRRGLHAEPRNIRSPRRRVERKTAKSLSPRAEGEQETGWGRWRGNNCISCPGRIFWSCFWRKVRSSANRRKQLPPWIHRGSPPMKH